MCSAVVHKYGLDRVFADGESADVNRVGEIDDANGDDAADEAVCKIDDVDDDKDEDHLTGLLFGAAAAVRSRWRSGGRAWLGWRRAPTSISGGIQQRESHA